MTTIVEALRFKPRTASRSVTPVVTPPPPGPELPYGVNCVGIQEGPDPFWDDVLFLYRNQDPVDLSLDSGTPLDESKQRNKWYLDSDNQQKDDFGAFCNKSLFCGQSTSSGGHIEILRENENWMRSDFTLEAYVAFDALDGSSLQQIMAQWNGSDRRVFEFYLNPVGTPGLRFNYSTDGTATIGALSHDFTPVIDQFYHVAVTRSGDTLKLYLDGVEVDSYDMAGVEFYPASSDGEGILIGFQARAHFSGIRLTKALRYTAAFTPAEFILTVHDKGAVIDPHFDKVVLLADFEIIRGYQGGSPHDFSRRDGTINKDSGAFIQTTTGAFGSNCGNFTSSIVSTRMPLTRGQFALGSQDFTLETWFRSGQTETSFRTIFGKRGFGSPGGFDWAWYLEAQTMRFQYSTDGVNSTSLVSTTPIGNTYYDEGWHYFACRRENGVLQFWINGEQLGDDISLSASIHNSSSAVWLGNSEDFNGGALRGRLDECRITLGFARDCSVVPTAPWPKGVYEDQR